MGAGSTIALVPTIIDALMELLAGVAGWAFESAVVLPEVLVTLLLELSGCISAGGMGLVIVDVEVEHQAGHHKHSNQRSSLASFPLAEAP